MRRGVYRIAHFPVADHEDLAALWLWGEQAGVFSHETALALHDLSDVLPAKVHMTVPGSWDERRLRVPRGLVLHFTDLADREWEWLEAVAITRPGRTLFDCIDAHPPARPHPPGAQASAGTRPRVAAREREPHQAPGECAEEDWMTVGC